MSEHDQSLTPQTDILYFVGQAVSRVAGSRCGFIHEALQNSFVAGATRFEIYSAGRGKEHQMMFVDNGKGMGPTGRQAFCDLGKSPYRNNPHVRSKHGYGRLSSMMKYRHVMVTDCSEQEADSGLMYVMEFDWEDLIRGYENRDTVIPVKAVPRNLSDVLLPEGATSGVSILLSGRRDRVEVLTVDTLVRDLARVLDLPPWHDEKNGVCAGAGEPMLPIQFESDNAEGSLLKWDEPKHGHLGAVKIQVAVDAHTDGRRQLRVGTVQETICSWRDFVNDIPPDLWDESLDILMHPLVRGHIHFSGLMPYRGGDSLSFVSELYASPVLPALLSFLRMQVVPDVQKKLEGSVKVQDSDEDQSLLDGLADMIRSVGSEKGTPLAPEPKKLMVSPSYVELECGHTREFEVTVHDPRISHIIWDTKNCAGRVSSLRDDGFRIRYTAPSKVDGGFGCYQLVAYDANNPATRFVVTIDVFAGYRLRISPATVRITPGARVELGVKGAADITDATKNGADVAWRLVDGERMPACGLAVLQTGEERLVGTTHGLSVMFQAGEEEGDFQVEAWVVNKREQTLASAQVHVLLPQPSRKKDGAEPTGGGEGGGNEIWLDGEQYTLTFMRLPQMDSMASLQPSKTGPSTVIINLGHPGFAPLKGNRIATLQVAFDRFLLAHYLHLGEVDVEAMGKFDDTRGKLAAGLQVSPSVEAVAKP